MFDKYQSYKKHKINYHPESKREINAENTNEIAFEADKYVTNSERLSYPRNKSVYIKSKDVVAHEDEKEGEFALKKDIIDLIEINLHQNYENKYIIDLSKYNSKVKKSNPEFITYGLLDIDPKINIKSYQNFNYMKLYNRYLSEVIRIKIFCIDFENNLITTRKAKMSFCEALINPSAKRTFLNPSKEQKSTYSAPQKTKR